MQYKVLNSFDPPTQDTLYAITVRLHSNDTGKKSTLSIWKMHVDNCLGSLQLESSNFCYTY